MPACSHINVCVKDLHTNTTKLSNMLIMFYILYGSWIHNADKEATLWVYTFCAVNMKNVQQTNMTRTPTPAKKKQTSSMESVIAF